MRAKVVNLNSFACIIDPIKKHPFPVNYACKTIQIRNFCMHNSAGEYGNSRYDLFELLLD